MEEIYFKSKKDNLGFSITCFTNGFNGKQVGEISNIMADTLLPWGICVAEDKAWIMVDNVD